MCVDQSSLDEEVFRFGQWASLILAISALSTSLLHCYMYIILDKIKGGAVKRSVTGDIKLAFWIEYSFTAPPITAVVLYYSGVIDMRTHIICFGSQAILMTCGLTIDLLRFIDRNGIGSEIKRTMFIIYVYLFFFGALSMASIWIPPLVELIQAGVDGEGPPWYVYALVIGEFGLFAAFPVAQMVFTIRDDLSEMSEISCFTVLSFSSKALLAVLFVKFL